MVQLGKASSALLAIVAFIGVAVLGLIIYNPAYLEVIIGLPLFIKIGAFLIAVLTIFLNYVTPRIDDIMVPGKELVVTQGALSTLLMGFVTIVVYVIAMNPTIILPLVGDAGAAYITVIGGVAAIAWNILKPRYGEFVGEEEEEEEPEEPVPEVIPVNEDIA